MDWREVQENRSKESKEKVIIYHYFWKFHVQRRQTRLAVNNKDIKLKRRWPIYRHPTLEGWHVNCFLTCRVLAHCDVCGSLSPNSCFPFPNWFWLLGNKNFKLGLRKVFFITFVEMDFIGSDQEYLRKLQNVQKPVCLNFFHASSGRVYQNKGLLLLLQRLPSLVQKRCENKCKMQKNAPNPHSMIDAGL